MVRYTYIYLSNLRAKNLEYNKFSQKRSICQRGTKKTECVLHKRGKVSWEQRTVSSALSLMPLSLIRTGNLLTQDKLLFWQRGEGVVGQRQEG